MDTRTFDTATLIWTCAHSDKQFCSNRYQVNTKHDKWPIPKIGICCLWSTFGVHFSLLISSIKHHLSLGRDGYNKQIEYLDFSTRKSPIEAYTDTSVKIVSENETVRKPSWNNNHHSPILHMGHQALTSADTHRGHWRIGSTQLSL